MWMLEQTMKGEPQTAIATALGVSTDTVQRELKRGIEKGWAEEWRDKMRATLADAPDVHAEIFDTDPETLHKFSRGYKLKLDAVNTLATGVGGYRPESHSTKETISLEAIAAEGDRPRGEDGFPLVSAERRRLMFGATSDEAVEGETVPDE